MKKISLIFILFAVALLFRKFFIPGPLVFGDAPYFYKEGLRELLSFPVAWTSRGYSLGGPNLFLWISPFMFLYGFLGTILHFNNDLIIKVLFYIPSLIFGFVGVYLLVKQLKFSNTVAFFAILFYLINTYFLLLVDGGQIGVVLAYGLFPFVLNFLIKDNFIIALTSSFVLTVIDFRVAAICILTAILLSPNLRKLRFLLLTSICLIGLSSYWIIPTLKLSVSGISTSISELQTTSLLNSLLISSPNWPANQFGKTIAPYFYFFLIPLLIFLPMFLIKQRKIVLLSILFLLFAFLAKGESEPLGFLYTFLVNTRIGSVFRDSTKFFIPAVLIGGILIGQSVEKINRKFFSLFVFAYILFLVWQGFFGKLNGVLGKNPNLANYQAIYNLINKDSGFLRDAWFNEKTPFAFHTEQKQALDAKDLVNFRPLASINTGTGDHFNFINNTQYLDWFNLLGIKYLVFNGNPREPQMTSEELVDWSRLQTLISKDTRLEKVDISTSIPVYKNPNIHPNKFFVDKTYVIIGGDDVYQKFLKLDGNFSVGNQSFLFPEDGKFDPSLLQNISSSSAVLVFNQKNENDLKMSFLQKDFVSLDKSYKSQWAVREPGDFLNWKYELLQKEIDTHEFDYDKGIAFSTEPDEKLSITMKVPEDGEYYLEVRSMSDLSGNLKIIFNNQENLIKPTKANTFEWFEFGPAKFEKGNYSLTLENPNGIQIVNTLALVSIEDMKAADQLTNNFVGYFKHFNLDNINDQLKLTQELENNKWSTVAKTGPGWIVYTDTYNDNWVGSYPMYSMINGFYVESEVASNPLVFKGDEYFKWGIYFSALSLLVIVITFISFSRINIRKFKE